MFEYNQHQIGDKAKKNSKLGQKINAEMKETPCCNKKLLRRTVWHNYIIELDNIFINCIIIVVIIIIWMWC
jgi:hypothetical protein